MVRLASLKLVLSVFVVAAAACGPPDRSLAGDVASTDGGGGDGTSCSPVSGETACDAALDAMCSRMVACCGQIQNCTSPKTVGECRMDIAASQPSMSCPQYAAKSVCDGDLTACTDLLPTASCADLANASAQSWPDPCMAIWSYLLY